MSNNVFAISNDIHQIIPFYPALTSGEVTDVIPKLQALAQAGNMWANYILGIYFIFGRVPGHYNFNKSYPVGFVKENAFVPICEQLGLGYLIQLLKIQGPHVESFHMKGIYDLFKIVEGKAAFFENNDIECRPTDTEYIQLKKLFDSPDQIRNLLVRLDHYEIYLDYAKHKLELFEQSNDENDFKTAVNCLNKIVEKSEFNQFNLYDISEAHYLLGKIHLFGNAYQRRDAKIGVAHIEASRIDKAYVLLLDFYKGFGETYIKSIRKCIGMITDESLRLRLTHENGFPVPKTVDIASLLKKLHFSPAIDNIEPAVSIDALPTENAETAYEEKLKEDDLLKESLEIAENFDPTLLLDSDDVDSSISMDLNDDIDDHFDQPDDIDSDFMIEEEFELPIFDDDDETDYP